MTALCAVAGLAVLVVVVVLLVVLAVVALVALRLAAKAAAATSTVGSGVMGALRTPGGTALAAPGRRKVGLVLQRRYQLPASHHPWSVPPPGTKTWVCPLVGCTVLEASLG